MDLLEKLLDDIKMQLIEMKDIIDDEDDEDELDNDECKECKREKELTSLRDLPVDVLKYLRKLASGRES